MARRGAAGSEEQEGPTTGPGEPGPGRAAGGGHGRGSSPPRALDTGPHRAPAGHRPRHRFPHANACRRHPKPTHSPRGRAERALPPRPDDRPPSFPPPRPQPPKARQDPQPAHAFPGSPFSPRGTRGAHDGTRATSGQGASGAWGGNREARGESRPDGEKRPEARSLGWGEKARGEARGKAGRRDRRSKRARRPARGNRVQGEQREAATAGRSGRRRKDEGAAWGGEGRGAGTAHRALGPASREVAGRSGGKRERGRERDTDAGGAADRRPSGRDHGWGRAVPRRRRGDGGTRAGEGRRTRAAPQPHPFHANPPVSLSLPSGTTAGPARPGRGTPPYAVSSLNPPPARPTVPRRTGGESSRASGRAGGGVGEAPSLRFAPLCCCCCARVNDPSAGSPTETLLRLLLPLDSQVRPSSQRSARAVGRPRRGRSEGLTKPSNR